jgi:hypothetical protein
MHNPLLELNRLVNRFDRYSFYLLGILLGKLSRLVELRELGSLLGLLILVPNDDCLLANSLLLRDMLLVGIVTRESFLSDKD